MSSISRPTQLTRLDASIEWPQIRSKQIDYSIVPRNEKYFVWLPPNYDGTKPFGLMVYISSFELVTAVPDGWEEVLARHKMLFVAPQSAGNNCKSQKRRCGLALASALAMKAKYNIESDRIVVAGISGGAEPHPIWVFYNVMFFKKPFKIAARIFIARSQTKMERT